MVDPKYLDPNEYWAQPSNTHQKAYLVKMGARIHNLLVDIKELLGNAKKDNSGGLGGLPTTHAVGQPAANNVPPVGAPRASTKPFVRPA